MTLLPRPTRADRAWRSRIAWGVTRRLSPDHPWLTSEVCGEGPQLVPWRAGKSRSRVTTFGTGVWPA